MSSEDGDASDEIHLRSPAGGLFCRRPIAGGMVLFDSLDQVAGAGFSPLEVCSDCRAVLAAVASRRN
jgi:hypothetical protein